ncbi:PREDICTED: protein-glutamine gamma-glutamyltransferase 4 [Tinamus guttatus]|uniref:protein-glutamine gamma-glutamyltransferase 4 n=1 Tax=Tinamus guttatus TaxID=94827 RepID=UPI00052EAD52|nr:PREDICTED: protein-glutamine gamma-glutamyltransferase 4 [Tinamus guttatus]
MVTGVDFLKGKNTRLHHTNAYENQSLVARRGQGIEMKLLFNKELSASDKLKLQLSIGEEPMKNQGTLISLNLRSGKSCNGWRATIITSSNKECLVTVTSPPNAIVGKYSLKVVTGSNSYKPENDAVYLLFNPWCKEDTVFMAGDAERNEYVLNDMGYIYVGSADHIRGRPWNFGQFEDLVLESCMYLLDQSKLKPNARRDPVLVSRAMSALVNANDDRGVLMGNWSGMYTGGTSPLVWVGSVAILQQYYKTKQSVLYGQCWVFSGVLTTVMRCLGIPSRSVSNFDSAHDTEENLRVDIYLNENREPLSNLTSDSIWNFHVWNDVWMKRPDLPAGFDGWQAIDSTPQEQSQGVYQCGPSPLKAVLEGHVYVNYDSKFVYAEVNADKVYWKVNVVNGRNKHTKLAVVTNAAGKNISTKAVGQNKREDITMQYKYPEGSLKERLSMQTATSFLSGSGSGTRYASAIVPRARMRDNVGPSPRDHDEEPPKPELELEITSKSPLYPGKPIDLDIIVKTFAPKSQTIHIAASCQLQSYTGKIKANIGCIKETIKLESKSEGKVPLKIAADKYMGMLASVGDEDVIKVTVIAEIEGTDKKFAKDMSLTFQYPPITVEMPETAKVDEEFSCAFVFKNTLSVALQDCKLCVEGLGMFKLTTFDQGDIEPGKIIKSRIICTPKRAGEKKIVATLASIQVKGISVEKTITIAE